MKIWLKWKLYTYVVGGQRQLQSGKGVHESPSQMLHLHLHHCHCLKPWQRGVLRSLHLFPLQGLHIGQQHFCVLGLQHMRMAYFQNLHESLNSEDKKIMRLMYIYCLWNSNNNDSYPLTSILSTISNIKLVRYVSWNPLFSEYVPGATFPQLHPPEWDWAAGHSRWSRPCL